MSQAYDSRICLGAALHIYPDTTVGRVGLPSSVTPSLTYYQLGRSSPKGVP